MASVPRFGVCLHRGMEKAAGTSHPTALPSLAQTNQEEFYPMDRAAVDACGAAAGDLSRRMAEAFEHALRRGLGEENTAAESEARDDE
jgi:hypothetical protein